MEFVFVWDNEMKTSPRVSTAVIIDTLGLSFFTVRLLL